MATPKIRSANSASTSTLAPDLSKNITLKDGQMYEVSLVKSENLSSKAQDAIFRLFDDNMLALQRNSSFPYTEQSKREELFDPDARYVLIRRPSPSFSASKNDSNAPRITTSNGKAKGKGKGKDKEVQIDLTQEELMGFCGFRFDTEETLSSRDAEVVYCYEVQISLKSRGMGLGKTLLDVLKSIGKRRQLDKIMLTCLKNNESALAFYAKQGYTPDEIDPTRMNEEKSTDSDDMEEGSDTSDEEVDYRILSKSLK
ncbi:uncharacterized protein L201_003414 [Kwoniella dendrophila CBS 6074]|uniref:N-alpha-acetyltransferase 40 n=1 Tax=Kwoniella dendrophila CBS 6074 TaxID=1295534 RepID=A0AAX4JUE1_9TREE